MKMQWFVTNVIHPLFACFMKMCELPVIYQIFFVYYITSSNI